VTDKNSGALTVDYRAKISEDWTLAERCRVAMAMLKLIQTDIYAGKYSIPGRPNITSIQHIMTMSTADIEVYRLHIEGVLDEGERGMREAFHRYGGESP
jgi:hypothetical protein